MIMCILIIPTYANKTENLIDVEEPIIIQPRFTNINVFSNYFDISSNGKASVTVYLNARNVDKVKVVAYLQQYKNGSWSTIKSWSETRDGTSSGIGKNYYVVSGYSYRLKSYGYVYVKDNLVETDSYLGGSEWY